LEREEDHDAATKKITVQLSDVLEQNIDTQVKMDELFKQLRQLSKYADMENTALGDMTDQLRQLSKNTDIENIVLGNIADQLQQILVNANSFSANMRDVISYLQSLSTKSDDNTLTVIARMVGELRRCRTVVTSPTGVTCIQYADDILLGIPSDEWRLAMYLAQGGHFEDGTELLFQNLVKPGMIVVDVGANVGIYTIYALKHGCTVYAFEPTPETFEILCENTLINGFEGSPNAHLYNLAVAEKAGELMLAKVKGISGHNSLFPENETNERVTVKAISLDEELDMLDRVDIVKIDVEGAEPLVLKGMQGLIAKNPNIKIFMEYAPQILERANVDKQEFLNQIRHQGMVIQIIDAITGELRYPSNDDLSRTGTENLLLTRRKDNQ